MTTTPAVRKVLVTGSGGLIAGALFRALGDRRQPDRFAVDISPIAAELSQCQFVVGKSRLASTD